MKTIRVRVGFAWAGIPDDIEEFEVDDDATEEEIDTEAYEYAEEMIFDRAGWDWEVVNEEE